MKCKKVLVMAGGTGGHVFPALAIAEKLKEKGVQILWLGSPGRMEEQLVPKYGFDIRYIDVRGVRRNGLSTLLKAPFMVARAVFQANRIIKEFKPDVVLGMGGYASGPGGFAAFLRGIPVVLHEQNAAAGMTNKLLFRIAKKVMLGFPGAFSGDKVSVVGNPVRQSILAIHQLDRNFDRKPVRISIIGGSLGAQALNRLVPEALKPFTKGQISVTHQCGRGNSESVKALYQDSAFEVKVSDFIDDMDNLYKNTDLIICRAGALTVAEVCCAKIPAIFVPLPSAVDDHQTKNAMFLKREGAALICPQAQLKPDSLYQEIRNLTENSGMLKEMSQNCSAAAITDATDRAVEIIDSVIRE
ncbi:MAG: undecaprenyldiphospho-muramoylpentapeptide beta-N-acetylglucosaminyltransferase [Succinivibrio sp.]